MQPLCSNFHRNVPDVFPQFVQRRIAAIWQLTEEVEDLGPCPARGGDGEKLASVRPVLAERQPDGLGDLDSCDGTHVEVSTAHRKCDELEDRLNQARRALAGLDRLTLSERR